MKKLNIGIMTFYAVQNYGAVLQAYALQQCLKKYNVEVELIRFCDKHNEHNEQSKASFSLAYRVRSMIKTLLRNPSIFIYYVNYKRNAQLLRKVVEGKSRMFSEFRDEYLNLSSEVYEDLETLKASNNIYDAYICGSDMVWTPIGQNLEAYFLQFAPHNKRFSFSPSLTGCSSFSDYDRTTIIKYLNEMRTLSCREKEGVEFVKKETGREALLTLDPTILMTKEQWSAELGINYISLRKPYILCYMFGGVPNCIMKQIRKVASKRNMDIRFIPMSPAEVLREHKLTETPYYGPKEFVELFFNASFIVTNTYHGFLFSLISENPFVVVRREKNNKWKANEGRISNLLDELELSERYIEFNQDLDEKFFELDYKELKERIDNLRENSVKYLSSIVGLINN